MRAMTRADRLEALLERELVRGCAAAGVPTLKLNLGGNRGWPDRLVLIRGGRPEFVEVKRFDRPLDPLQVYRRAILQELGYAVTVIDDQMGRDAVLQRVRDLG